MQPVFHTGQRLGSGRALSREYRPEPNSRVQQALTPLQFRRYIQLRCDMRTVR